MLSSGRILPATSLIIFVFTMSSVLSQSVNVTKDHRGIIQYHKAHCRKIIQDSNDRLEESLRHTPATDALKDYEAVLILLAFAFVFFVISLIYYLIRRRLNYDCHLLDTFYDGGGDHSSALVWCFVVAKWCWSSTYSQSAYAVVQYGLAGGLWFSVGQLVPILLFSIVAMETRIKAPGAKTYLQIIRVRYGKQVHWLMIIFALLVNLVIVAMVIMQGTYIIDGLSSGVGEEVLVLLLVIASGAAVVMSGMGGLLYISYFACVFLMCMCAYYMIDIFWDPTTRSSNPFPSRSAVYDTVSCIKSDDENKDNSAMTFTATNAMIDGLLILLASFTHVFLDQSFWLAAVTCRPKHTVASFIVAAVTWFAIPFSLSLVFGLIYLCYNASIGMMLTVDDETKGMIPLVLSLILKKAGTYLLFAVTIVATVVASSSQILSMSSIGMYDIYQIYINKFQDKSSSNDNNVTLRVKRAIKSDNYLQYDSRCHRIRYICVAIATVVCYPAAIVALVSDTSFFWLFSVAAIFGGGCLFPVTFSVTWHRTSSLAIVIGSVGGLVAGVVTWLCVAANQKGGLSDFLKNTGEHTVLLAGCAVSIGFGGISSVIVSLITSACCGRTVNQEEEWEVTRSIDNPIMPWLVRYAPDLHNPNAQDGRMKKAHFYTVRNAYKAAEICAYVCGVVLSVLVALVWPACMLVIGEFDGSVFNSWLYVALVWVLIALFFVGVVPLVWETVKLVQQWRSSIAWDRVAMKKGEDDLTQSVYSYNTADTCSVDTDIKLDRDEDFDMNDLQMGMFNKTPEASIGKSIGSSIATEATIHKVSGSSDYISPRSSSSDPTPSTSKDSIPYGSKEPISHSSTDPTPYPTNEEFDNGGYEVEEFDDGTLKIKF